MAVLDSKDILFEAFEPQLTNRFVMNIDGIPAYLIKGVNAPGYTADVVTLFHINSYRKLRGRVTWDSLTLNLYSPIVPSAAQAVMEWSRLAYESGTGRAGYSDFYKKDISLQVIGPVGDVVSQWDIYGAFPSVAKFGSFDATQGGAPVEVTLTLELDYCILNY